MIKTEPTASTGAIPDALSGVTTYTFSAAPEANKILLTDGDGNLSWTESFDSDLNVTGIVTATGGFNIGINLQEIQLPQDQFRI